MAHDAATGYLPLSTKDSNEALANHAAMSQQEAYSSSNSWKAISKDFLALYGKTQVGTVYDQLNHGARALDLRPKLYTNGTIGFHHGSLIDIPLSSITLGNLLEDAKQWCKDNPKELVIIFHSKMVHEAGYNGLASQVYMETTDDGYDAANNNNDANQDLDDMFYDDALQQNYYNDDQANQDDNVNNDNSNNDDNDQSASYSYYYNGIAALRGVYENHGVPYYPCEKLGNLTVGEAMDLADLTKLGGKGYLLAVDRHDMYASLCGKANRAQYSLVTCYSSHYATNDNNVQAQQHNAESNSQSYMQCTDRKGTGQAKLNALRSYVKASTNNEPTDNSNELGPPADYLTYPFNQIQGFWQVDASSVQVGLMHESTLLDDNRVSQVNAEMVRMAYNNEFDSVSIFSMDNVALNGNAMFSVLRNQCDQSAISNDDDGLHACGQQLVMPQMNVSTTLPIFWNVVLFVIYGALAAMVLVMLVQAFRMRNKELRDQNSLICSGSIIT